MSLDRIWMPSPNYSSRGGATVRLIVVHTSEGAQTYQSLANFFANPSNEVSSHTGIDDASPGVIGEYCSRSNKSWTAADANPYSVQTELCTPSGAAQGWSAATWATKKTMLANCAAWIAEEAAIFHIPIVKLTPAQAQGGAAGVCGHGDLGQMGGGHTDPGPNFPWAEVLGGSPGVAAPTPTPPPAVSGAAAPPWPGRYLAYPPVMQGTDVATWQTQMAVRGWDIVADGQYGPASADVCISFQREKALQADGIVGPDTWAAAWTAPVT